MTGVSGIRLLALDIDGTLLNSNKEIFGRNLSAINAARALVSGWLW